MKNFAQTFFILAGLLQSAALWGQPPDGVTNHRVSLNSLERELFLRQAQSQQTQHEIEERLHAQVLEAQFTERVHRFVQAWSGFIGEYNRKRAFDVKKAKEVSKAFRELEKCEGWLSLDRK